MPLPILVTSSGGSAAVPTIVTPLLGQFCPVGYPVAVVVTVPAGTSSCSVQLGAGSPVAASIVGTTATASITPVSGDASVTATLTVTLNGGGSASVVVDVEDNITLFYDPKDANSYTASGGVLTSVKNLITGAALSTVTGSPKIGTDPRDGQAAFVFDGAASSYIEGVDAGVIAAVTGTDRPYTLITVQTPGDVSQNLCSFSVRNSAVTGNGVEAFVSAGAWYVERDGAPTGPARLLGGEAAQAGLSIVVQRSSDGLTQKTSINGGADTTTTALSAGALSPNIVALGVQSGSTKTLPMYGYVKKVIFSGTYKTDAQVAAIVARLQREFALAPQVVMVGDSITASLTATNGGMPGLLVAAVRTAGGIASAQGPYATNMPFPHRHSGVAGDTCGLMLTRVNDNTLGLGKGGAKKGYFQRARLICLFAGTNATSGTAAATATAYSTLLDAIYTAQLTLGVGFKIAVTTATDVGTANAYIASYNALLPAIWDAFEAAHPGILIRWNAFACAPTRSDGTHPNDAGYVSLVSDPTNGLAQAVVPYLMSIQP